MTAKQLTHIGIALVAALFLWGLSVMIGGRSDEIEELEVLPALGPDDADTIEFVHAADTVRLTRSDEGIWSVNGHATSVAAVDGLFAALAEPVTASLVAVSASSHERMGVTADQADRLRVVAGDRVVADVMLSRQGGQGRSVYLRRDGDDRVYQMRGGLAAMTGRGVNDWRDKTIARVEPAEVQRVEVERGRDRYTLVRVEDAWMLDGVPADTARVEKMLRRYINLQAEGRTFATDAEAGSADFRRPDRRMTLLGGAGDTLAALLYDSIDTGYWVRHAAGGTVYHMYRYRVEVSVPVDTNLMPR